MIACTSHTFGGVLADSSGVTEFLAVEALENLLDCFGLHGEEAKLDFVDDKAIVSLLGCHCELDDVGSFVCLIVHEAFDLVDSLVFNLLHEILVG